MLLGRVFNIFLLITFLLITPLYLKADTTIYGDSVTGSALAPSSVTIPTLTQGSVLFSGAGGLVSQDNAKLFWDNTNKRLGIGMTSPQALLDANGAIITRGPLSAHQTSAGVFEYTSNKTSIRAYGATAGTGYIAFNTGGGGNSVDAEAMRITGVGTVGIGTMSPTAITHIKAGTAAANTAPLKLTTGVNLTTPEAGAMEYVTPKLTITDGGAVRQELTQTAYGSLYENGAGTVITMTTAGIWYQWITSTVGGQSLLVTESGSAGTNNLTIAAGGDGVYFIAANVITAGANNIQTHWAVCKGGAPLFNVQIERFLTGATVRNSAATTGIVRLIAGDVVDLRVSGAANGDATTQYHVGLNIYRIGR